MLDFIKAVGLLLLFMIRRKMKETFCIIDDEPLVIKALYQELIDYANDKKLLLKTYTSPIECLEELKQISNEVSVIISDLRMPEMKGSEFLMAVRNQYPDIELMLLTAYNDISDIQRAVSATIRALILKPWDPDMLISEIEKAREIYRIKQENKIYLTKINKQLEIAADFQKKLLETEIPTIENADIELTYIPLPRMKIGGDYYDIIKIDEHRFFLLIGDVTGHGVKPSFVSAMLKVLTLSFTSNIKMGEYSPSGFVEAINFQLCKVLKNATDVLITFSCLLIDTENLILTLANAGHLPVFIVRQEMCTAYHIDGPALGFSPEIKYKEIEIPFISGDIISIYTDGILESEIEHTKIPDDVVKRFLIQARKTKSFNNSVLDQLKLVREIEDFHDDVTFISVHV